MNRVNSGNKRLVEIIFTILFLATVLSVNSTAQNGRRIAAFGSSVCNGTGDESDGGGYIGRFKALMSKYDWEVVNVSRGGDNTVKIQDRWQKGENPSKLKVNENQYLIPQKPDYVIIGLSLANEGIRKNSKKGIDSVFEQFKTGMNGIIERCVKEGYKVVIANCYPHLQYTEPQYAAIRKMNLLINDWKLPSINILGTIDDGNGHWVEGFYHNEGHPSSGGHKEIYYSIVPTLFDALSKNKPTPEFSISKRYGSVEYSTEPAISYTPRDTIHSFSVSFSIRNPKNITALKIGGKTASLIKGQYKNNNESRNNFSIAASKDTMNASLKFEPGRAVYVSGSGAESVYEMKIDSSKWYTVTVTSIPSKGETKIYLDNEMIFRIDERIIPQRFKVGLRGKCDIKNVLLYRSSLNSDEIRSNLDGHLIQSSLEIYAPLSDEKFSLNKGVNNLAQSLSSFSVKGKIQPKTD